jgi:quinol monooxygenase YgiN
LIIIAGTIDFEPPQREPALAAAEKLVEATREQSGCLDYAWMPDRVTPGRVYVFERWEDEKSLRGHFEGHFYADMLGILRGFGRIATDIWKYRPELTERVYDSNGVPRADFFTESSN